jgi:hypothetical protein
LPKEDQKVGGEVRAAVPAALAALEDSGAIMQVDGVWRLQTKEAAEWDSVNLGSNPGPPANSFNGLRNSAEPVAVVGRPQVGPVRKSALPAEVA